MPLGQQPPVNVLHRTRSEVRLLATAGRLQAWPSLCSRGRDRTRPTQGQHCRGGGGRRGPRPTPPAGPLPGEPHLLHHAVALNGIGELSSQALQLKVFLLQRENVGCKDSQDLVPSRGLLHPWGASAPQLPVPHSAPPSHTAVTALLLDCPDHHLTPSHASTLQTPSQPIPLLQPRPRSKALL